MKPYYATENASVKQRRQPYRDMTKHRRKVCAFVSFLGAVYFDSNESFSLNFGAKPCEKNLGFPEFPANFNLYNAFPKRLNSVAFLPALL